MRRSFLLFALGPLALALPVVLAQDNAGDAPTLAQARGLALGTISHGQGTAQAVVEGELQGAAAGIAMGCAAVFTSVVAPKMPGAPAT